MDRGDAGYDEGTGDDYEGKDEDKGGKDSDKGARVDEGTDCLVYTSPRPRYA